MTEMLTEADAVTAEDLEPDQADRLRKSLRVSGMGVQEMADALLVERNTIGRYLSGKSQPTRVRLRAWASRTGVPVEWLENGDVSALRACRDSNPKPSDP